MGYTALQAMKGILKASPLKEVELAELMGTTPQNLNNKLSTGCRKDITVRLASEILGYLGYQVAMVPKGKRLPEGSVLVSYDEDL